MHCITCASWQCFMHFRCVFTLLLCCVLIYLDWVEPMIHLYLHVTCSCIFMQTYLQVSIFVILYLVGAFLIVSLTISYVSCVMAPKRKSIPSRNPFRSRASSSSSPSPFDPTPSHVQFRDEKAKSDFLENFSQRGIVKCTPPRSRVLHGVATYLI